MLYDYVLIWLLILYKTFRFWPLVTWWRLWHKQWPRSLALSPELFTRGPILSNSPGATTLCHSRLYPPSQRLICLEIKKELFRAQSIQSAMPESPGRSSELAPPTPPFQASVPPPPQGSKWGMVHTLVGRGWREPIQMKGQILWYSVY